MAKKLVLLTLTAAFLVGLVGCSPVRPDVEQGAKMRAIAKSVQDANDACQAGSIAECLTAIQATQDFFLLVRTVDANPDWLEDAKFEYNAAVNSADRCRANHSLCATLASYHAGEVAVFQAVAEKE